MGYNDQTGRPRRQGQTWHQQEVDALRNQVAKGISIQRIAELHGRSELAIQCAMEKWDITWDRTQNILSDKPVIERTLKEIYVINGVNYTKKFELAAKVVMSVINGDNKYVRIGDKIWSEVTE